MSGCNCKFGDYVRYIPELTEYIVTPEESGYSHPQTFNPSENTLWKVFYEEEGNEILLISARSIGTLTLEGQIGFANGVGALNRLCSAYANPKVAVGGRSIGCTENSISELKVETCCCDWVKNASPTERQPYDEKECEEDLSWLRCSGLMKKSNRYVWLASRHSEESLFHTVHFGMSAWNGCRDEKESVCLYKSYPAGGGYSYRASYGVRPVIRLRSDARFGFGAGSKERPYVFLE